LTTTSYSAHSHLTALGIASEHSTPQWKLKSPEAWRPLLFCYCHSPIWKKPKSDNELLHKASLVIFT